MDTVLGGSLIPLVVIVVLVILVVLAFRRR